MDRRALDRLAALEEILLGAERLCAGKGWFASACLCPRCGGRFHWIVQDESRMDPLLLLAHHSRGRFWVSGFEVVVSDPKYSRNPGVSGPVAVTIRCRDCSEDTPWLHVFDPPLSAEELSLAQALLSSGVIGQRVRDEQPLTDDV